jgi:multidrug efflux pump subunit AcrB
MNDHQQKPGFITRVVSLFLSSRLAIIFILLSLLLGLAALMAMPKEEDPQIVVPMADVMVSVPGVNAKEVEKLVATPLGQFLQQIKGVEDVYAVSTNGHALVTVKFYVGTNQEQALVRLHNQMQTHLDDVPPLVKSWVIKPITINDVPIVNVVLYSHKYNDFQLRRIGGEVLARLMQLPSLSKTSMIGGRSLRARVEFSPGRMAGFGVTPRQVYQAVKAADVSVVAGRLDQNNQQFDVETQSFLTTPASLGNLVVAVHKDKPVYLRDVASVEYGANEAAHYTFIGFSQAFRQKHHMQGAPVSYPAVTLALAKKSGTNAVTVAQSILTKLNTLKKTVIPSDVQVRVTRNYGQTAHDKVNELLKSLSLAIATVIIVLVLSLGWREALIVATSVPISFALALFVDFLFGYSINRVTLFALILSLGLVVDDPITNVENIQRHIHKGKENLFNAILSAVNEVLPPVIMASLTIIVSFIPLFFITGMMGPYMAPMAFTVPLTIVFSTVASLTVVPWMAYKLLKPKKLSGGASASKTKHGTVSPRIKKYYSRLVLPFLMSRKKRYGLLGGIVALLLGCVLLVLLGGVPLKLLPFDNKNEIQLVINLPEGSTLEQTNRATMAFENYLQISPYVTSFTSYIGTPSPMDFNGMVRHYYLRKADNLADIRVNLLPKSERSVQSHEVGLLMRRHLQTIAKQYHAKLSIVEMPPGPPVMQTLVAQVEGAPGMKYQQLIQGAKYVEQMLRKEKLVVDINDSTQMPREQIDFIVDKEKAALNGVSTEAIAQTLRLALGETTPMTLHVANERRALPITFRMPRADRTNTTDLSQLTIMGKSGHLVPLIALGHFVKTKHSQPIAQKNLNRLVYVYANTAGRPPADVVLSMENQLKKNPPPPGVKVNWSGEGAWKITIRVFRDMGIGFAAAMLAIYLLLFIQTDSFLLPLIMMLAIPLTVIGIIPGFWLLNLIANHPVGGFPTPIFFTATSMIGMIALGGIVIRNSVILVDFIDKSIASGMAFKDAVLESGAVRLRPIVLTALTAALGAWPITLDPIFSGLAWALIFGLFASTTFTLLVIPVTYYALFRKKYETGDDL